jgi:hypothetical protein
MYCIPYHLQSQEFHILHLEIVLHYRIRKQVPSKLFTTNDDV